MIKHGMNFQRKAIQYLNPGQIPVITIDLASLLWQSVQWKWPETHGENLYVAMLGGLHIEMWNTLGNLMEGSRWTATLTETEVASAGMADSFFKSSTIY